MSLAAIAGTVCPTLGVVLCNALYFTPLTAALERSKKGSLGSLNPLPAALTVLSNIAWLSYGYAISNPYIVAGNLPGAIAAITALVTILPLMKGAASLRTTQAVFVGGCAAVMSVWSWLVFTGATAATRASVLGILATVICILLFSSPLSTIKTVFSQRSSESIYAPATAAQCANCALWTTYGWFATKDIFVWGPNLTGLMLGLAQLALKLAFPSKK